MTNHGSVSVVLQRMADSLCDMRDSMADIESHVQSQRADLTMKEMVDLQRKSLIAYDVFAMAIEGLMMSQGSHSRKPLSECRCMTNLRTLGSDKTEFKSWNDKFVNAVAQSLGAPWRKFLRNLNRVLDQERKVLDDIDLAMIEGAANINHKSGDREVEDIFYVLVEKTEGDAALRVNSGEPGEGLAAYMRIYLWFAGTTGLALSLKTQAIMNPTPVKHESEIADALERWSESERTLRAHGDTYRLNAAFRVTALRILMSCKNEQFEQMEREAKSKHGDKICDDMFDDLYARVREYAQQRRLEELTRKSRGTPMDIGEAQVPSSSTYSDAWNSLHCTWHGSDHDTIDALGKGKGTLKGKGKGKGKANMQCYACGQFGHIAMYCPNPSPKAKGKGGKAPPTCWSCGAVGHTQSACPYTANVPIKGWDGAWKGLPKGQQKGGKSAYEISADYTEAYDDAYAPAAEDQAPAREVESQMLGGSDIAQVVIPWQVATRRSRSKHDMRPEKPVKIASPIASNSLFARPITSNTGLVSKWQRRVMAGTPAVASGSGQIESVDMNAPTVNAVSTAHGQWERIPMKVDSGAVATVMPPCVARHFKVCETPLSKKGPGFRAANGTPIKHYGQRAINGVGDRFQPLGLVAQVADVNSTLGSVHQMLRAGQCVHFETGNCYIRDMKSGQVTKMEEKNGTFEVGIWVPRLASSSMPECAQSECQSLGAVSRSVAVSRRQPVSASQTRAISTSNRFSALEEDECDVACKMPGFTWQDEHM